MKVTDLRLTNVRSIKTAEMRFQPGFNLVVGENGVGKTTVIETLAICLFEFEHRYNRSKIGEPRPFKDDDVRLGAESMDVTCGFERDDTKYLFMMHKPRGQSADRRGKKGFIGSQPPTDPGISTRSPYAEKSISEGRPLGVLYSTTRAVASERWPRQTIGGRSRAYQGALSDRTVQLGYFASWMRVNQEFNLERNEPLLRDLENTVRRFLPGYSNLRLGGADDRSLLIDRRGGTLPVRHLSHGERSILAVVLDLTRRLGTANPGMNNPPVEAAAVVLIDEIDLHLHPRWQRQIRHNLTTAFPRCQFIVTTHSPQIIGEVEHDRIQILTEDGAFSPTHSFGVDASRVLEEIMEAEPRNREVSDMLSRVSQLIDSERFREARELLGKLNERVGSNDPDVTGLGTLIDFVEGKDWEPSQRVRNRRA